MLQLSPSESAPYYYCFVERMHLQEDLRTYQLDVWTIAKVDDKIISNVVLPLSFTVLARKGFAMVGEKSKAVFFSSRRRIVTGRTKRGRGKEKEGRKEGRKENEDEDEDGSVKSQRGLFRPTESSRIASRRVNRLC
ncbi:hypothetical protein V1478_016148 [Vespula squamosa]|uniref:Uncharacterized protein n=1 Tax=Vespula squamosa TaxID=30214 RepID=A0ABD1ZZ12_VESSQ